MEQFPTAQDVGVIRGRGAHRPSFDLLVDRHIPESRHQEHVFRDRIRHTLPVVTRAVARGELPEGTDPAEMIKTLVAPIYFRVLITGERVDDETADAAARLALTSARAGLFAGHGRPQ
ncbi:TetR-like C-terminal domain-containing protein [Nocardia sp. BSTN01]|uniref:TetR-like C-terminal domain-containing protein n=1 Tax=Nocardia sp. BSTN01 TaxID=2783665 RepID=UPI001E581992